ncbi:MAG: hypothetical protein ACRD1K_12470 [Acidimicrobiales bacterium]
MGDDTIFATPGRADRLDKNLLAKWNTEVRRSYGRLVPSHGSRFFKLDPAGIVGPTNAPVQWFADPAEPRFCLGPEAARQLSDWGVRGRHELHNEYCEYTVTSRADASGVLRPKRVQITTELREYWLVLATHAPAVVRKLAGAIVGRPVGWEDLYGPGAGDPTRLAPDRRKVLFATQVAGHGNDDDLVARRVPAQPKGRLNTDNALFMTHPINGLDDLLYIVMFGARPYARRGVTPRQAATREQIFRHAGVPASGLPPCRSGGGHGCGRCRLQRAGRRLRRPARGVHPSVHHRRVPLRGRGGAAALGAVEPGPGRHAPAARVRPR